MNETFIAPAILQSQLVRRMSTSGDGPLGQCAVEGPPKTVRPGWAQCSLGASVAWTDYARAVGIRFERESDRPSIRAMHLAAFGDHGKVVADLVDDLRSAVAKGEGLSLVAEETDEVVRHTMFTAQLA
jgi:hypothetical protein